MNTEWASVNYDEHTAPQAYDETTSVEWGPGFTLDMLRHSIERSNFRQFVDLENHLMTNIQIGEHTTDPLYYCSILMRGSLEATPVESVRDYREDYIRRVIVADNIDAVLGSAGEMHLPLFLPPSVITFANDMIQEALREHDLPTELALTPVFIKDQAVVVQEWRDKYPRGLQHQRASFDERSVYWNMSPILAWQQIDRRIDECVPHWVTCC